VVNREGRDPVCGMLVVSGAKYRSEHNGNDIYFCCEGCQQAFDKPRKYALSMST
jgi:YHS domain-containing protein